MKKRPFGLKLLCLLGFLSGGLVVLIFMEPNTGHVPAYLGMIYIALNVGLWLFHNWARKGLQAVDLFCWGIFRKYERGETTWYDVFRERIAGEVIHRF